MEFKLPPSLLNESVLLDVIEHLPAGVFAKDQGNEFQFVIWNREMERIFATPRELMLGKNDYDFFAPAEADYYRQTDIDVMNGGVVIDIAEERVTTKRGQIIAHTIKVPVTLNDGRQILLGILEDITETLENRRKIAEYQAHLEQLVEARTHALRELACRDPLTGLSNRAHFFEVLDARIAGPDGERFSLIYLDLDRFKLVNDTYGHDFGDQILKVIGVRLQEKSDLTINVARIGGDEFAILLDAPIDSSAVDAFCSELLASLRSRIELEGRSFQIDASLGVCGFPDDAKASRQMLQQADMAMYCAKQQRQSQRWCRFTTTLQLQTSHDLSIEQGILQAIANDELFIEYQPQFLAAESLTMTGLEALARWRSPMLGLVPPATFIPVAERIGFVSQITDFVLDAVCKDLQRLDAQGICLPRVSINVSSTELDEGTAARIEACLRRHGVSPERITLEITENAPLTSSIRMFSAFDGLRRQGLRLSIDDFGTGYSSLAYIAELAINEIKIDRSFVRAFLENGKSESIIRAIVGIGEAFGYQIVAEGVESEAQLAELAKFDGLVVQGFLTARPAPIEALLHLVGEGEGSQGGLRATPGFQWAPAC
ncbi:MAG: EAL domain-containing protein [Azonexus sp.]|nr:EAL domain-containing protein [Azonexus sp.]